MRRLDLQFYSFFMVVLCGALLGLLFDLLRVTRRHYQPNPWVGGAADLLFWIVATAALSGGLFYGNWGEVRFYVVVGLFLGIGLYYWLASPIVTQLVLLVFHCVEWLIGLVVTLFLRLIWAPLAALAGLLWSTAQILGRWLMAFATGLWHALERLLLWITTPLIGPYRCMKLHYLLTKRRFKRRLRHWLLGPPKNRRR